MATRRVTVVSLSSVSPATATAPATEMATKRPAEEELNADAAKVAKQTAKQDFLAVFQYADKSTSQLNSQVTIWPVELM